MKGLRILGVADRRPQRWKNGGGITSDVAAFPPSVGMEDFDWRISIAEVAEAGPFSRFDGVERVLTVIEGELILSFGVGAAPVTLTIRSDPFAFAADVPVSGEPLNGTVRDLNVMVRRGRVTATVERVLVKPGASLTLDMAATGVMVALDSLTIRTAGEVHALEALDAAMVHGIPSCTVAATDAEAARLVLIALDRLQ